jgi:hypothetical protein
MCVSFSALAWIYTQDNSPGALEFLPSDLPAAKIGEPYEVKIAIVGNVTPVGAFSVNPQLLPPGLTLTHNPPEDFATLSGIPTQAGAYTFTVDVWCFGTNVSGQTGEKTYELIVTSD